MSSSAGSDMLTATGAEFKVSRERSVGEGMSLSPSD